MIFGLVVTTIGLIFAGDTFQETLAQSSNNLTIIEEFKINSIISSKNATSVAEKPVNVSIVPGSSALTDTAYDPNPVEIEIGQSVLWTNDDTAFHTVTSGEIGDSDSGQLFDSGMAGPTALITKGKTFEHNFEEAGEYHYYCILHPGMEGTVIVI